MRNVERVGKPPSLENNAKKWTAELLAEIKKRRRDPKKVPGKLYEKYKRDDIREALNVMYKGLCCYCEMQIAPVSFDHVEHRYPKKKYPKRTYEWDNLHLACTQCKVSKGDEFDSKNPILDAVLDEISKHLSYRIDILGVWCEAKSSRGKTTRKHANLNRLQLRLDRVKIYLEAKEFIKILREDPHNPKLSNARQWLEALCDGPYGSVIRWAMDRKPELRSEEDAE